MATPALVLACTAVWSITKMFIFTSSPCSHQHDEVEQARSRILRRSRDRKKKKIENILGFAASSRRKRKENAAHISKTKRNRILQMKRSQHTQQRQLKPSKNLPELMSGLLSNDPTLQLKCITGFRKLLSKEFNPPIGQVIAAGAVPHFVQFLSLHDYPALQFEAAWALTNIVAGSSRRTEIVIETGAVRPFVQLLASPNEDVREQVNCKPYFDVSFFFFAVSQSLHANLFFLKASWALGNIAGDSPQCRDFVLQQGAMGPLLQNLKESSHNRSLMRHAVWTLSNLCRGKPLPANELVRPALPVLAHCIYSADDEVLADACWALAFLSEDDSNIQQVIESGVCRRLVELIM